MFSLLWQCRDLKILHYVTDEDERHPSDHNRILMMEVFDHLVCKQLHDVCLCACTVYGWGINTDVIRKYHERITFTVFDKMKDYYAEHSGYI